MTLGTPLPSAPTGRQLIVSEVDYQEEGMTRLATLGIVIGTEVELVKCGDPMLIKIQGNLFAFEKRLCDNVEVVIA